MKFWIKNNFGVQLAGWSAVGIGCALPISPALDNLLLATVLLGWLLAAPFTETLKQVRGNPLVLAAALLYTALLAGSMYGPGDAAAARNYLGKYLDVAFVPIFVWIFAQPLWRERALMSFAVTMAVVLLLSLGLGAGLIPVEHFAAKSVRYPGVFKLSITHNFFMTAFALLMLLQGSRQSRRSLCVACWALGLLAVFNMLFMIPGRTGQLALILIVVYLAVRRMGTRGVLLAGSVAALMVGAAFLSSHTFKESILLGTKQVQTWQPGQGKNESSSMGTRLDYYSNTLAIIRQHPWIGVGTGGFEAAYARQVAGTQMANSNNPHNQYLLFAAQLGVGGMLLLLTYWYCVWKTIRKEADPFYRLLGMGVLIALVVGNMFNSFFLDHAEGLFSAWILSLVGARYLSSGSSVDRQHTHDS